MVGVVIKAHIMVIGKFQPEPAVERVNGYKPIQLLKSSDRNILLLVLRAEVLRDGYYIQKDLRIHLYSSALNLNGPDVMSICEHIRPIQVVPQMVSLQ